MRLRTFLASAALLLLAGCGGEEGDVGTSTGERGEVPTRTPAPTDDAPGEGTSAEGNEQPAEPVSDDPQVIWDGDDLVVVAFGSSSCPPKARSIEVKSPTQWVIDVTPKTTTQPCTMDLVASRSRIEAPTNAPAAGDVTVVVVHDGVRTEPMEIQPGR